MSRLFRKGQLQEAEPSNDIATAYLQRSEESLSSAKALLRIGNLKDTVALAYYAMYHCLLAVLFRIGIKCENHTAAIMVLKEAFELDTTALIVKAKSERVDKQYYVDFEVMKEEAESAIAVAEEFVSKMTNLIATLTEQRVKEYHERAVRLFKDKNP